MKQQHEIKRLPSWFKIGIKTTQRFKHVLHCVQEKKLHTVCESAACPNRNECWNSGTATFLILGNVCTRSCGFCNITSGRPGPLDHEEPNRVAEAVRSLELSYAVVTSVTRDDLPDGGAQVFAETIRCIREASPGTDIEVLIPDFKGSETALDIVLEARPNVLNHNIETVPSLYRIVRPGADYRRSINLLRQAKERGFMTKSGMMLGLGEKLDEVRMVMEDLRKAGCDILTIGQYLRPRKDLLPVVKFYHPDEFISLKKNAVSLGFKYVVSAPFARSSYRAGHHVSLN